MFYQKNLQWQKDVETDVLYKKIMSQRDREIKNKIPKNYFKPKTNCDVNQKLVKTPFEQRLKNYELKKDKSLKKLKREMYNHDFKPKKYNKKMNRSFW